MAHNIEFIDNDYFRRADTKHLICFLGEENAFEIKDVKEVCSDSELLSSGFTCSSIYIKSLAVSGN